MTDNATRPADFNDYWDGVDRDLARYEARPQLEPMPLHSTDFCTVYALKLTSIGPYRLFGYYSVPHGDGPFPAMYNTPKYGSVNHVPDYNDRQRYVCLTLMHRGQRLANQPFAAEYPGLLTLGIDDPSTYIYRSIAADCIRGAEFLQSRAEVDQSRVAIIGDDLAMIAAARRPGFAVVEASAFIFYRMMEAAVSHEWLSVGRGERIPERPSRETRCGRRNRRPFRPAVPRRPHRTGTTCSRLAMTARPADSDWLAPFADACAGRVEYYQAHQHGRHRPRLARRLAGR